MNRLLGYLALTATVCLTAYGEWLFAMRVGWPALVAVAMPVSLDVYVILSFRTRRDVGPALALMAGTNVLAHLVEVVPVMATAVTVDGREVMRPAWWVVAAASALPPVVLWRIHRITSEVLPAVEPEAVREAPPQPASTAGQDAREALSTTGREASPEAPATPLPAAAVTTPAPASRDIATTGRKRPARERRAADRRTHADLVAAAYEADREAIQATGKPLSYRRAAEILGVRFDRAKAALDEARRLGAAVDAA